MHLSKVVLHFFDLPRDGAVPARGNRFCARRPNAMSPPPHLSHPWRTSPGAPLGARPSVGRGRIARHPATASISYAVPRASALAEAEARQPAIIQHQLLGCLARNNIGSALKERARRMNPALLVRIFEGDWRHHFPYGGWRHQFPYGGWRHHCPYGGWTSRMMRS